MFIRPYGEYKHFGGRLPRPPMVLPVAVKWPYFFFGAAFLTAFFAAGFLVAAFLVAMVAILPSLQCAHCS
jgi:hypothetical protein